MDVGRGDLDHTLLSQLSRDLRCYSHIAGFGEAVVSTKYPNLFLSKILINDLLLLWEGCKPIINRDANKALHFGLHQMLRADMNQEQKRTIYLFVLVPFIKRYLSISIEGEYLIQRSPGLLRESYSQSVCLVYSQDSFNVVPDCSGRVTHTV
jgi:hypothetical protein